MQGLRLTVRGVHEMRVGSSEVPGEFVQRIVANQDVVRYVKDTVVGVELFDGGAPTGRITLSEDLLKVSMEKFSNSLSRSHVPVVFLRGVGLPDALGEAKRTAVLFHTAPVGSQRGGSIE